MRPPLVLLAAVLLSLFGIPAAAHAATVSVQHTAIPPECSKCGSGGGRSDIRFRAAPGESNDVTISRTAGTPARVRFADAGAPLTAGQDCAAQADGSVLCPVVTGTLVELGDGPDRLAVDPAAGGLGLVVRGEDGDDRLTGGDFSELLTGGPGADVLDGRGGNDQVSDGDGAAKSADDLDGGPGADSVLGGGGQDHVRGGEGADVVGDGDATAAPGPDVLDGGPGADRVSYEVRTAPVSVDLAVPGPLHGQAGEGDTLLGIESARTGPARDRLFGDAGPNELDGGAGLDVVDGRAGDDAISAGLEDRATCGDGRDLLAAPSPAQLVGPDCELLGTGGVVIRRPRADDGRLVLKVPCQSDPNVTGCRVAVAVGPRGSFGRAQSRPVGAGRVARLVVPLTAAGRAALAAGDPVRFGLAWRYPRGFPQMLTSRFTLGS